MSKDYLLHTSHYIPLGFLLVGFSFLTSRVVLSQYQQIQNVPQVQGVIDSTLSADTNLAQLPADFPTLPIYPNSQINQIQELSNTDNSVYIVEWQTSVDHPAPILEYMSQNMKLLGWQALTTENNSQIFTKEKTTVKFTISNLESTTQKLTAFVRISR